MSMHARSTTRLPHLFTESEMDRINRFIDANDALTVEERMQKAGVRWWTRERGVVVPGDDFHPVRRVIAQADANARGGR